MHGTVGLGHVIERAPAGEVGFVLRVADVTGILVPGEFLAGFGAFDDVLLPKQIHVIAEGGLAHFGHQVAEKKLAQARLVAEAVGY